MVIVIFSVLMVFGITLSVIYSVSNKNGLFSTCYNSNKKRLKERLLNIVEVSKKKKRHAAILICLAVYCLSFYAVGFAFGQNDTDTHEKVEDSVDLKSSFTETAAEDQETQINDPDDDNNNADILNEEKISGDLILLLEEKDENYETEVKIYFNSGSRDLIYSIFEGKYGFSPELYEDKDQYLAHSQNINEKDRLADYQEFIKKYDSVKTEITREIMRAFFEKYNVSEEQIVSLDSWSAILKISMKNVIAFSEDAAVDWMTVPIDETSIIYE